MPVSAEFVAQLGEVVDLPAEGQDDVLIARRPHGLGASLEVEDGQTAVPMPTWTEHHTPPASGPRQVMVAVIASCAGGIWRLIGS